MAHVGMTSVGQWDLRQNRIGREIDAVHRVRVVVVENAVDCDVVRPLTGGGQGEIRGIRIGEEIRHVRVFGQLITGVARAPIHFAGDGIREKRVMRRAACNVVGVRTRQLRKLSGGAGAIDAGETRGTSQATDSAMRSVRLGIDLASVARILIAIAKPRIATETAGSSGACGSCIGRAGANIAAHAAMRDRRLRIRFTTIRRLAVAIAEASVTREPTRSCRARAHGIRGARTNVSTEAAVHRICTERHFAAVGNHVIAIGFALTANRRAGSCNAYTCRVRIRTAHGLTIAAMGGIVLRIDARSSAQRRAARANEGTRSSLTNLTLRAGIVAAAAMGRIILSIDAGVVAFRRSGSANERAHAVDAAQAGGANIATSAAIHGILCRIDTRTAALRGASAANQAANAIAAYLVRTTHVEAASAILRVRRDICARAPAFHGIAGAKQSTLALTANFTKAAEVVARAAMSGIELRVDTRIAALRGSSRARHATRAIVANFVRSTDGAARPAIGRIMLDIDAGIAAFRRTTGTIQAACAIDTNFALCTGLSTTSTIRRVGLDIDARPVTQRLRRRTSARTTRAAASAATAAGTRTSAGCDRVCRTSIASATNPARCHEQRGYGQRAQFPRMIPLHLSLQCSCGFNGRRHRRTTATENSRAL